MKFNKFVLLATIMLFAVAIRAHGDHGHHHDDEEEDGPSDDNVINMNEVNFNEVITEHDLALVMFFAPWCGHCKNLKPHWSEASKSLATNKKVALGKVDCTVEATLCQLNKVEYYPTLVLFRNGVPEPFELNERTASGIVNALTSELLPPITSVETEEDLEKLKAEGKDVIVGFFDNDHDDRYTTFKKLVTPMKKFIKFGAVINKEFSAKHVKSTPSANIYTKFEDSPVVPFTGNFEPEELTQFIRSSILPTLGEINEHTYKKYDGCGLPIAYLFINPKEKEATETTVAEVTKIAAAHKGKIVFCSVNNVKYPQQAKYLGLSGSKVPALAIEISAKGQKFLFPEDSEWSQTAVSEFVQQYLDNKLVPFMKSEPIPADNSQSVKVIVGKTYEQIVLDETKDVLVEFYAPWCGHCKSLEPIYKQLGDYMAENPHVVIAKVDATANDVPPELAIRGFPTIKYFKATDKKNPVEYNGQRDLASLVEFIQEHSTQTLKFSKTVEEFSGVEAESDIDEEPEVAVKKNKLPHDEL
ncbi:protein disulfide isomerase [Heterostelium album PN500]|uniref:Protein disulfide-isomerase n=1 Tax=Heterostelium pallidum (strain ATCC 26659 / Pp 5 / PN500) TaxID=670386 RepID=D3BPL3_HETP5|nr:protein disulfide isomerase [Heterostelium album PN500]EFA76633.1 protein disulfide isomerase [Heterostelium album PN500]|eukprot:XP_020428765.1 protein disulfide isomerase [Heterostelium album PN500]